MRLVSITSSLDADPGFERDTTGVLGSLFFFLTAGFGNGSLPKEVNKAAAEVDMAGRWIYHRFLWFAFCSSVFIQAVPTR